MIFLKPNAGLANRMRAIDSAISLSKALGSPLLIYWVRGSDLNCAFHSLFEPFHDPLIQISERSIRPLRFLQTHRKYPQSLRRLFSGNLVFSVYDTDRLRALDVQAIGNKNLVIESFSRFYPNANSFQSFKPTPFIRELIADRTASFNQHTIGVHIRRTDNVKSIDQSPDDLFIERMHQEVNAEPLTRFYLASDSPDVKEKFLKEFGDRILTTSNPVSRNTPEGIQDALVELYALSSTSKILGSFWSSFSSVAAEIGGIKHFTIKLKSNS